ncbi:MAG: hypothetical protein MZW92_77555 [Comamonadaceae bacterium]|nr:hypothetical protein [Comamonadaceae bacterium]
MIAVQFERLQGLPRRVCERGSTIGLSTLAPSRTRRQRTPTLRGRRHARAMHSAAVSTLRVVHHAAVPTEFHFACRAAAAARARLLRRGRCARACMRCVNWLASEQLPWQVVDERPYHALLLARGARASDAQHLAVLRLSADAERYAIDRYGDAMPAMALRKPLQPMQLRVVLEMAAASLIPEHVAAASPQTRPHVPVHAGQPAPRRPTLL